MSLHRPVLSAVLLAMLATAGSARATDPSRASQASLAASIDVPLASMEALAASGRFSVVAITPLADGARVLLQSAASGARFSLELSRDALIASSLAVGTLVTVSAVSAGWLLSAGGAIIAYVPNALADSMIHHRPLPR